MGKADTEKRYDCIAIGLGPAALNAALYNARYKVDTLLIGEMPGGLMSLSHDVPNWIGIKSIKGLDLTKQFMDHVKEYDVDIAYDYVTEISGELGNFELKTRGNKTYKARTVLFATGSKHRHLGCPGEEEFAGKGVHYCTTCDGFFYKDKDVIIVGGGDSALTAAIYMADVANKTYLIHRRDEFRADPTWVDIAKTKETVNLILTNGVTEIHGGEDGKVQKVSLKEEYNGSKELSVDGVFIEIGSDPDDTLPKMLGVECTPTRHCIVKADQSTNIEGIFAAGENTTNSNHYNQIVTACAEGAIASNSIQGLIQKLNRAK